MHVCIVGTGASGWMCCNALKTLDFIEKITIIGSPSIPTIGVGESNTIVFIRDFLDVLISNGDFTYEEFIRGTDAAIKYGVKYVNWSKKDFIHNFKHFNRTDKPTHYGRLLANKDENTYIHDIFDSYITKIIFDNHVSLDENEYPVSFHFDAAKFIDFFSKNALKNSKVNFISGTVDGVLKKDDEVQSILVDRKLCVADYYVFATGDTKLNDKILQIKYKDLSDVLLTNKAVVYPLQYTDKRNQFHPYTIAKTMKYGWRWITPTWSRIGTGYVFSTNHISIDEAIDEFLSDIGDKTLKPMVVNFEPKYNETPFHKNYCTLGMAQGFLEPLDAPGITITIKTILELVEYLSNKEKLTNINSELERLNEIICEQYKFWCSFILCQYKTCSRNDTNFWEDQKLAKYEPYDTIISNLDNYYYADSCELFMFQQTIASKDIKWKTNLKSPPYKVLEKKYPAIHHLDYLQTIHEKVY